MIIAGPAEERHFGAKRKEIIAGYAITRNVDAEFWDLFVSQHKDQEWLINKLIVWWPTEGDDASIRDQAKEGEALRSGYEPLDLPLIGGQPITDPRAKQLRARLSK